MRGYANALTKVGCDPYKKLYLLIPRSFCHSNNSCPAYTAAPRTLTNEKDILMEFLNPIAILPTFHHKHVFSFKNTCRRCITHSLTHKHIQSTKIKRARVVKLRVPLRCYTVLRQVMLGQAREECGDFQFGV